MSKLLGLLDAVGMAATNLSAQMRPATPMIAKSSTVNSGSIQAAIKNPPK